MIGRVATRTAFQYYEGYLYHKGMALASFFFRIVTKARKPSNSQAEVEDRPEACVFSALDSSPSPPADSPRFALVAAGGRG